MTFTLTPPDVRDSTPILRPLPNIGDEGAYRQELHEEHTTPRLHHDRALENHYGAIVQRAFADWWGLALEHWDGTAHPAGWQFATRIGKIGVRGCSVTPWYLPLKELAIQIGEIDYVVLGHIRQPDRTVAFLRWASREEMAWSRVLNDKVGEKTRRRVLARCRPIEELRWLLIAAGYEER